MANKQVITPRSTITPAAGERKGVRLINGTRSWGVLLHAKATVDITAAGSAVRNRGSVWAIFDEVVVDENGSDRHLYDGRVLRFLSEMHAPSALSSTRLTGAGIQAGTVIQESAMIWFAHPLQAQSFETAFREADARQTLEVFVKQSSNALATLITGGTGTVTAISVSVTQLHDPRSTVRPVFIPIARETTQAIAGANTKEEIFIKTPHHIRALVLQQEDDAGERSDIINKIALRGDFRDLIGPQQLSLEEITRLGEFEFGGSVFASQSQIGFNFQRSGRLSNVINPADDVNLRFELDVSASGTNPKVRLAVLELERVAGLVTDSIPFPI